MCPNSIATTMQTATTANRFRSFPAMWRHAIAMAMLIWLVVGSCSGEETIYSVGVAKVDITPSYPIRLNGFGFRRAESVGVTSPIYVRALAIGSDAERPIVLVTIDSTGIRLSMVDEVADRLKRRAGIERDRFVVTFTHTHTSPKLNGVCDTIFSSPIPAEHQAHLDRYTQEVTDALEKVALAALQDRRPAKLAWGKGTVGFAKNRRMPGGPVDHDLPMLVVKSADEGTIRAIYVSYACHCVTLSDNKISGDWAGFAATAIERNSPGAVALVSIGCGSDSNPDSGVTGDKYAVAAEQGGQIAAEVARLLQGALHPISGAIDASMSRIDLPLADVPTREQLEKLAAADDAVGFNAKYQLAKLDRGESLLASIAYPVQVWSFGDSLCMVFLGGEVCVDYSARIKRELDPMRLWVHGYSNEMCCYIPSERLLREGGYGGGAETVYFALPTALRAGVEDKIIDEVRRQVPTQFHNGDPTKKAAADESMSPAESLASIRVTDGLAVELMAAEPLVVDPVAIDFGADGRLWVAEMRDYSRGVDDEFEQTGQVTVLRDTDGNGSLDDSTAFGGGLRFPTDVKAWRNGVIMCDAPDVIYLEDTDGDGRADVKKTLLTGFATHNAQARVNSLRWGLDGWLYGSCGLFGGQIKSFNGEELELRSRDFRFQPDSGKLEAVTGRTQQGRARDDWQNWFGCENGTLIKHYPLVDRYLARNPRIAPPEDEIFVPAGPEPNRLFPLGEPTLFKLSGPPGRPTSVCGLEIYRDELLGTAFRGNSFSCEPVNQLVHRLVLSPLGITFAGERAEGESRREFLASTDPWFRPVQARTGPDGCLWIVDMHRKVIEHPRFIPEETLRQIDVMAGHTTGRIFRVRRKDAEPRPSLQLEKLAVPELVAALDSPNGPQRDMVQQLLMQRHAAEAAPALLQLVEASPRPEVRLQALYTLSSLGKLEGESVRRALQDSHPGVRRHALVLSESLLASDTSVAAAVLSLTDDGDPQVQMQLAYSLGDWQDARAYAALSRLALAHHAEKYILSAVLNSATRTSAAPIVHEILSSAGDGELPKSLIDALILLASRLGDSKCMGEVLAAFSRAKDGRVPAWRLQAAADLIGALDDKERTRLLQGEGNQAHVKALAAAAQDVLQDSLAGEAASLAALRLVVATEPRSDPIRETISRMLGPQSSPDTQRAAVSVLVESKQDWAAELVLENWTRYTPVSRARVLANFFERQRLIPLLLSAMKSGDVRPTDLSALQRQTLMTFPDAAVRADAATVFSGAINADRAKVIESYADLRQLTGDVARGRALFSKSCSSCHKLEGQGHSVGPDLAALTDRSVAALLESVLDPNRQIDERYQVFTAITDDGLTHSGILLHENATSITLLGQEGKEESLLRSSLDDFSTSRLSLMPEGFERDISQQGMADVLAYVADQGTPPKQLAGNRPTLVRPDAQGVIRLKAATGEVHGQDIVFEQPCQNIGFWHGDKDFVGWKATVPRDGVYEMYLHWACADDSAGNAAIVEGGETPVRFVVSSTGGYDNYIVKSIGTVRLTAGVQYFVVRADGPMSRRNLLDLRALILAPEGKAVDTRSADAADGP